MTRRLAGVAGAAGLIAVLTLAARVVGFGRWFVFAEAVRSGGVGGIYQMVNTVPNVLYEVAAGGLLAAVAVPLIGAALGAGERERADRVASVLLTWTLAGLVPLGALVLLLAAPVSGLFVAGSDPAAREVGATLLRVFAVQIPLYGIGIILSGLLQAHRRFLAVALAPLLSSLVVIAAYLAYGALADGRTDPAQVPGAAVQVIGWGTTLGVAVLSLPLLVPARRTGWRWRPHWRLPEAEGRRLRSLAGAGMLALLAQQAAALVTMWLAKETGDAGTFPVYQYAQAVYLLPYAVLAVPVAMSVFPALAQQSGAERDAAPLVGRSLRAVLALSGLATGVLVAVAAPVGAFFTALDSRRGSGPSSAALAALPATLTAYAPGLVGFAAAALLTRALYVRGRPLLAAVAVAAGWAVAGLVPLLAVADGATPAITLRSLGIWSSVGMTLSALLLALLVRRAWGPAALAGSGRTSGVVVVLVALAVAVGDLVTRGRTPTGIGAAIGVGVAAALAAGVAGLLVLAVGDRATFMAAVRRKRSSGVPS